MSADDQLDQDRWNPGGPIPKPGPMMLGPEPTVTFLHPTAAQQIRAAALQAAAAFANRELPWWERETVLELAETWAAWIETGERT